MDNDRWKLFGRIADSFSIFGPLFGTIFLAIISFVKQTHPNEALKWLHGVRRLYVVLACLFILAAAGSIAVYRSRPWLGPVHEEIPPYNYQPVEAEVLSDPTRNEVSGKPTPSGHYPKDRQVRNLGKVDATLTFGELISRQSSYRIATGLGSAGAMPGFEGRTPGGAKVTYSMSFRFADEVVSPRLSIRTDEAVVVLEPTIDSKKSKWSEGYVSVLKQRRRNAQVTAHLQLSQEYLSAYLQFSDTRASGRLVLGDSWVRFSLPQKLRPSAAAPSILLPRTGKFTIFSDYFGDSLGATQ